MQAITTKFLAPTNTKPARIKATVKAGSITMDYAHHVNEDTNHANAAWELMLKFGWQNHSQIVGTGQLVNGDYCHVLGYK